jgi:hypothetical protein
MILPNIAQQPQYPQTNVNIDFPRGIQLSVILAPGVVLSTTLGPDMVEQLYANWQAAKQAQAQELKIIQHVNETKNGHH